MNLLTRPQDHFAVKFHSAALRTASIHLTQFCPSGLVPHRQAIWSSRSTLPRKDELNSYARCTLSSRFPFYGLGSEAVMQW